MKKMLIGGAIAASLALVGVGGFQLWPKSDHVQTTAVSSSSASSTKSATKHHSAAKPGHRSAEAESGSESVSGSAVATSTQSSGSATSSTAASKATSTSTTTGTSASHQAVTGGSTTSGRPNATTSSSSTEVTTSPAPGRTLSTAQVNNWVWSQVAPQYANMALKQNDFLFAHQMDGGLDNVYVYENNNANGGAAHLAGVYRVNAQGQLEHLAIATNTWQVVANSPAN